MHPAAKLLISCHLPSQDRELARLRAEALTLAAQAEGGGAEAVAAAEAAELAGRVLELERRCSELQVGLTRFQNCFKGLFNYTGCSRDACLDRPGFVPWSLNARMANM